MLTNTLDNLADVLFTSAISFALMFSGTLGFTTAFALAKYISS